MNTLLILLLTLFGDGLPPQIPADSTPNRVDLPFEITTGQAWMQMANNADQRLLIQDWKEGVTDQEENYAQYRNKQNGVLTTSYMRRYHSRVVRCVLYGRSKTIHAIWNKSNRSAYPRVGVNKWEGENVRIELQERKQGMAALQATILDKTRVFF
jgi:hypothetical protein